MTWSRLHDGPRAEMAPKVANLARVAAAGLPVPEGFAIALADIDAAADDDTLHQLWAAGPTIVRSALASEDGALHSGAGLGVSVGGVRDAAGLRAAAAEIRAARRHAATGDQILVQREIEAVARAVVACEDGRDYLEQYDGSLDAFAGRDTPTFSGPLRSWASSHAEATRSILERLRTVIGTTAHGLDVELALDAAGGVHLVQVRPLTAPLHPGWADFVAAVRDAGDEIPATGTLILDVEHNPEPLSFAHARLVRWLARERPRTGGLAPLAGWLYTRVLIRDLAKGCEQITPSPRTVALRLQREIIPAARARYAAIEAACASAGASAIDALFADAFAAFLAMIDVYVGELIPARQGFSALVPDPADPLCLRGRDDVLDVLPVAWDVAAPVLGTRIVASSLAPMIPDDDAGAATLLREWDDHLFGLGLAPLRAVYRRVGVLSGLGDDVFALAPAECIAALAGDDVGASIRARTIARTRAAELSPPGRIVDGEPAGVPPRWLRGLPIGPSFVGPVAARRDLAHLRGEPPAAGSIVVLPALTAPAAVVLHELGLRAICCEHGGAMSHAALMARELGLSALLGCRGCTTIADGTVVELDTRRGVMRPRVPAVR